MLEDFENYSGKYWAVLDALGDRFKVRWKRYWSVELWDKLQQLKQQGRAAEGIKLLPNRASNIKLVNYRTFNPMLLRSEVDEETGEYKTEKQQNKKAITMQYVYDAAGIKFRFFVTTENDTLVNVLVDENEKLDTLAQYEGTLAAQLGEAARQLFAQ